MHYVSFNFGRDLGELHSLLTVFFISCIARDLCPGLIRVVLYRSFSHTWSYGRRDVILKPSVVQTVPYRDCVRNFLFN